MLWLNLFLATGPWLGLMVVVVLFAFCLSWLDRKRPPRHPIAKSSWILYIFAAEFPLFVMLESAAAASLSSSGLLPALLSLVALHGTVIRHTSER